MKILREADEAPVSEVAKKHGLSDVTMYAWRKRFGMLEAVDVKRLRQIEHENTRLKKLLAERDLEIEVMRKGAAKNGRRARASPTGRVRSRTRCVDPASVRDDVSGKVDIEVPIALGSTRCAGGRGDARARRSVSPLRLSTDPGVPGAP